jgi:hypothetical protein
MSKPKLIPISEKKIPLVKDWQTSTEEFELNGYGIGLVCGRLSGQVEAIDFDLKYDLSGTLMSRWKALVMESDKALLKKLVIQKTVSDGFHIVYRCEKIEGNKKLAQREANDEERVKGEKIKVLIETRGEGGYIAIAPTPGYKLLQGDFENIPLITENERELLINCSAQLNEYFQEYKPVQRDFKPQAGLSPFEDYNNRSDVVGLLQRHSWTVVKQKGSKVLLKRPGQTSAAHSGNYDEQRNWFSVFSSSTEFEPQKSYLPYAVYAILECKGDYAEASRQLYELGYGDRKQERVSETPQKKSKISLVDENYSFIAQPDDYVPYLTAVANGTLEMGKTTGMYKLDQHWLFKKGAFVIVNGHDNVGKSVVIWFLFLLAAMYHGWKGIIYTAENSVGFFYRKMIEFYWSEEYVKLSQEERDEAKQFIDLHFTVIRNGNELYNYEDILVMFEKINSKNKHELALIDPYNSLAEPDGVNGHSFHQKAISNLKLFGMNSGLSIYVNTHAVTEALRFTDKDGHPIAPKKAHVEGGGKVAAKADDFITMHRKTQHETDWMNTEIHVRKIKETETGGKPTIMNKPVVLRSKPKVVGFTCDSEDPVWNWRQVKKGILPVYHNPETRTFEERAPNWAQEEATAIKPNEDWQKNLSDEMEAMDEIEKHF